MSADQTVREIWKAFIIAGVRSKFGATALLLMLAIAAWQFVSGDWRRGGLILAIAALTYARIPAAIGAAINVRQSERRTP